MLILISDAFDKGLSGKLSKFGEVTDDKNRVNEADVVLIRSKTKVTKEYMDAAPNLKLVIRGGVGLDNVDLEYAKEKGVAVHNTADASSIAVAECAFTLMIGITNHIGRADSSMRNGQWIKKELKRTELYGKTLGIVGLGRIGTELAKRAIAFGMTVIAFDPFVESSDFAEMKSEMKDVLNVSDYVSLHLPLIDSTKGIINSETLKEFKDGAFLINTGRGKTINEEDLVDALKSGKIAGFGNDVWYSDPPETNPFTELPNVLMMPHLGASTKENLLRIGDIVENIITEFVK
ncbi:MAG: hydroxyacid dehydrogenase [Candidatus Marinimicrobia bacterium]|nr:hydroxyacid dehydrogenase [Candidatus Neomarinimicrobiota bacterium]MBL7023685.1 hydroxyacid dehydrogenase [Candidatus Neomarinimicrobiota bacterium]MBL7110164.1 hydroxyacid dehydrogenase [Candidatus Neomarinimicrobiota bacterium]